MSFVYGYSVFWVLFLIYLFKTKREYGRYIYLVLVWAISSVASIIYYSALPYNYGRVEIFPYLFLLICLLFSFHPFYTRDDDIKNISIGNKKLFHMIIIVLGVVSVLPFLENLVHIISTYGATNTDSLADVYSDKMSGDFDRSKYIDWFSFVGRIGNSINLKFQYCSLFLFFLYLCIPGKKKLYTFLLLLSVTNPVLYQLGMSGRSTLVFTFLRAVLLFLIFRSFLDGKLKRMIIKYGLITLAAGVLLLSIITLARYRTNAGANSISLMAWVSLYIGEGSLNFNNNMWYTNALTEGDNCFSFFKSLLGIETFTDYLERRAYWGPRTGVDPVRFYTFVGDIYSDFSYFVLPLLLFIGVFLRKMVIHKNAVTLFKVYLLYSWGYICVTGITCYTLKTFQSMIDFTFGLLVVYIISRRGRLTNMQTITSNKYEK